MDTTNVNQFDSGESFDSLEDSSEAMRVTGNKIDLLIKRIRDEICVSRPEQLLFQIAELYWISGTKLQDDTMMLGPSSDHFYPVEYVQSLLSVRQPHKPRNVTDSELSDIGYQVLNDLQDLSELVDRYVFYWTFQISSVEDEELSKSALEAQLMYMVRGNRYQSVQRQYFEPLIQPHDSEIRKLFGISAKELIDGLMRIENALSQGKLGWIDELKKAERTLPNGLETRPNELPAAERDRLHKVFTDAFTVAKYNVRNITNWPDRLVRELSFSIGEGEYFDKGRYQYWPIVAQPIWERPFITINGETYCFDYWSTMDNFYRCLQRTIEQIDPAYSNTWTSVQQRASEGMVARVFSEMLPGSAVYVNNYYGSKKNRDENDVLIKYADALIIVEVKAGAFTYAPPITDFESHINRYKALIEKADSQCLRFKRYIHSCGSEISLYEGNKVTSARKAVIDLNEVTDVFTISVTLDNVNAFAARAEKLSFLNMEDGGISIAIDDLLTYQCYFDSSLQFLHFLKQRRAASRNPRLALYDELDHLGMYIAHNCYFMEAEDIEKSNFLVFDGYRNELDNYFNLLINGSPDAKKPVQSMPKLFEDILRFIEGSDIRNKVQLSSYLLDFSDDAREKYSQGVLSVLNRQDASGRQQPMHYMGGEKSLKLTTFVVQPSLVDLISIAEMARYTAAVLLANEEDSRWLIVLYFDEDKAFTSIESKLIYSRDISEPERSQLLEKGKLLSDYRVKKYVNEHGKIGRNQPCPCGSGKKYKKCHGKM